MWRGVSTRKVNAVTEEVVWAQLLGVSAINKGLDETLARFTQQPG